jgi:hypothetical protein
MRSLTAALLLVLASPAVAHVAPSEDANNRYLKLSASGDRVRLAYTVFMGQQPGRQERARLDRNHDGTISDAEANVFRDRLADQVASSLAVTVDGRGQPVTWAQRYIGLGTPITAAGAFSVDLVAWLCFSAAGTEHTIELRDRFHLASPGDTELRVEQSPGVIVTRSTIGASTESTLDFKWVGDTTYLQDGLRVELKVGPDAPPADAACTTAAAAKGPGGKGWGIARWGVLVGAVLAAAIIGGLAYRRSQRAA